MACRPYKFYSVYERGTEMPIIIHATIKECVQQLGITEESFRSYVSHTRHGTRCCHPCVPPKRHPGCHDRCPEYAAEKAENDRLKEADAKRRKVKNDIYNQRAENVSKALKRHGRN